MGIISGRLPPHTIKQRPNGSYICSGGDNRGYGKTPDEAYNEWVYLTRYNSDESNYYG